MKQRIIGVVLAVMAVTLCSSPYAPGPRESGSKPSPTDIPAARMIADPYPAFNGIAVDSDNNLVILSDPNRKSLLFYERARTNSHGEASAPMRQIIGPQTYIGMVAGVAVDAQRRQIYTANNDIEDTVIVMPYEAQGNAKPARVFSVPHQAWGLALGLQSDQIAVSVEVQNALVFYRREAHGVEAPVRIIRGPGTGLADPHGVYWDELHNEVAAANHGNFRGLVRNPGGGCIPNQQVDETAEEGKFQPPSIVIFRANAQGDAAPLRVIQGDHTGLDWPMAIAADPAHDTIVVANNGDDSIRVFDRTREGDVPPVRVIRGPHTGINRPMGVAVDAANGEIWVSNWNDHSALVFDSAADGDVSPRRVVRGAPADAPTPGFGNPMALAYDGKREELLVPN
jgi:DNA-binding beta-propeller fold protein YncE